MYYRSTARRRMRISSRPFVAFLLVASFGILFAGCSAEPETEIFTFTADDVARFRELASGGVGSTGTSMASGSHLVPRLELPGGTSGSAAVVLDVSVVPAYNAIRSGPGATGENVYRVNNAFLNVRSEPRVNAPEVARLVEGDVVAVKEFVDAAWAKATMVDGKEGYVAVRYIAKLTSEDRLPEERKKFEGQYFVDFGFLNVRGAPDANAEKIGELPGQALVKPLSMDNVWARVPFNGKEGYVAVQYLSPFLPNFLVRQEDYRLPILHYRLAGGDDAMLTGLKQHVERLKADGVNIMTLRQFYDIVLQQEERDVRVPPKSVVLAVSDITPGNVQKLSTVLSDASVKATLFLSTKDLGLTGITEKMVLTLLANGHDLQSAGHMGEDLRSLTNAQVDLEVKQSRQLLERITQKTVYAMGYPWGGVNDRVMEKAAEAGYLFGIGSAPERTFTRAQFLRLPSFVITTSTTADDVAQIATGE